MDLKKNHSWHENYGIVGGEVFLTKTSRRRGRRCDIDVRLYEINGANPCHVNLFIADVLGQIDRTYQSDNDRVGD